MRFAIMTWVPTSDNARIGTIFGILDNDAPGNLPLLPNGYWEHYHIADERTLKFAEEARKASRDGRQSAVLCAAQMRACRPRIWVRF